MDPIENFVTYSLRYQLLLAQHVAGICNKPVYVFDKNGFFNLPEDTKVEIIDSVRTVSKDGLRAVLSVAVKESFGTNEELFIKYLDKNVVGSDDIGLYVVPVVPQEVYQKNEEVSEEHESNEEEISEEHESNEEEISEEHESNEEEISEEHESNKKKETDLKEITKAIEKLDSIL
jgi:TATA-binding protein-associated factor Taf7